MTSILTTEQSTICRFDVKWAENVFECNLVVGKELNQYIHGLRHRDNAHEMQLGAGHLALCPRTYGCQRASKIQNNQSLTISARCVVILDLGLVLGLGLG